MAFEKFTGRSGCTILFVSVSEDYMIYVSPPILNQFSIKPGDNVTFLFDQEKNKVGIIKSATGCRYSKSNGISGSKFCKCYHIKRGQYKLPVTIEAYEGQPCLTFVVEVENLTDRSSNG